MATSRTCRGRTEYRDGRRYNELLPDGNMMYLTRARREPNSPTTVEIFTSQRSDAKWSARLNM